MSAPHHRPTLDISAWLDREAVRYDQRETRDAERATRLREAATVIRTLRAQLVAARMGKVVRV